MENTSASGGDFKFTFLLVLAMVAMGVSSGMRVPPTSPPTPEGAELTALPSDVQNLPARLWQDPIEATETARRTQTASNPSGGSVAAGTCLLKLVEARLHNPEARIILLFVSLPSDPHPEASEQRIRTRVAVVSALSTAGYRPVSSSRLGLAVWNANDHRIATQTTPITTQTAYPYEAFRLDSERRALESDRNVVGKPVEIVVLYLEENSLNPEFQFEWIKQVSRFLASTSGNERGRIAVRWLGPNTSDRLLELLRSAWLARSDRATEQSVAIPVKVIAARPRIEPELVSRILNPIDEAQHALENPALDQSGLLNLVQCHDNCGQCVPWLTLERLGCDDSLLTGALVKELKLRRPELFRPDKGRGGGVIALISEWDTLYGRALPRSFESAFVHAGGNSDQIRRYTYLRGLNGQIIGSVEKVANTKKTQSAEPLDLFRQLLQSRAPTIDYGRTQVDYVDRLAAQLQAAQDGDRNQRLVAIGVLGTDTTDKLLILQGLRKVFPCVQYFTTELDAALFAPDQYPITRNLLVATGFALQLRKEYQGTILPFRDSGQSAAYLGTLEAAEFFDGQNRRMVHRWTPAVFEIGRSGPSLLSQAPPGVEPDDYQISLFPQTERPGRSDCMYWMSPLLAAAVIGGSLLAHHGHLALRRSLTATHMACLQFAHIGRRRDKWTMIVRLLRRVIFDLPTWLLMAGTLVFFYVAARAPWIAARPGEEPFFLSEGISSWPAIWLRALAVFLAAYYFWIIGWQFRLALASGQRELRNIAPEGCQDSEHSYRSTPCQAWKEFCQRSRGWKSKALIVASWAAYIGLAMLLFRTVNPPANTVRGIISPIWDKKVLMLAVLSMHLLIFFAVAHNLSCAFFVRKVAQWLRSPDIPETHRQPLHTALMRAIAHVTNAMTRMIYYPFILLFLIIAARQSFFDNFDWPMALVMIFAISFGMLLTSTFLIRRSADYARQAATTWLGEMVARLKWKQASTPEDKRQETDRRALAQAEWQLTQIQQIGGAALTEGLFTNPLLRAVLIPLGGTGLFQALDFLGKSF